jgi:hypothetical protein
VRTVGAPRRQRGHSAECVAVDKLPRHPARAVNPGSSQKPIFPSGRQRGEAAVLKHSCVQTTSP